MSHGPQRVKVYFEPQMQSFGGHEQPTAEGTDNLEQNLPFLGQILIFFNEIQFPCTSAML